MKKLEESASTSPLMLSADIPSTQLPPPASAAAEVDASVAIPSTDARIPGSLYLLRDCAAARSRRGCGACEIRRRRSRAADTRLAVPTGLRAAWPSHSLLCGLWVRKVRRNRAEKTAATNSDGDGGQGGGEWFASTRDAEISKIWLYERPAAVGLHVAGLRVG
ncbi:hypothetical protein ABZP36_033710 [Zizania latifolia]